MRGSTKPIRYLRGTSVLVGELLAPDWARGLTEGPRARTIARRVARGFE